MNTFRGDPNDISAKTATLLTCRYRRSYVPKHILSRLKASRSASTRSQANEDDSDVSGDDEDDDRDADSSSRSIGERVKASTSQDSTTTTQEALQASPSATADPELNGDSSTLPEGGGEDEQDGKVWWKPFIPTWDAQVPTDPMEVIYAAHWRKIHRCGTEMRTIRIQCFFFSQNIS